jgi:hypothetical protein
MTEFLLFYYKKCINLKVEIVDFETIQLTNK